ncbi:RNA-directed DNA polymerase from mobile element jockey [Lucilia cuprina]|nr:RNA-directed DNA polymerase from mobile element jockey [Lucilia cuprina]
MIRILQKLYDNTTSQVWDGSILSKPFTVTQGVKQGCLLSPVLFALYLKDLHEYLPGGIIVSGTVVKVLLYVDDIVLLSDCPIMLQNMIDALHKYCDLWCLKVNLDKSKIMIFRNSARISRDLSWKYGNNQIDIVNEYKYLGIILTYNLSFRKHIAAKLTSSKIAINSTWLSYIHHPKINISNKLKIFHSAAKSILFYGAQIWGVLSFDEAEKWLRYFLKRILCLPRNTPNYMLHLDIK